MDCVDSSISWEINGNLCIMFSFVGRHTMMGGAIYRVSEKKRNPNNVDLSRLGKQTKSQ